MNKIERFLTRLATLAALPALSFALITVANAQTYDNYGQDYGSQGTDQYSQPQTQTQPQYQGQNQNQGQTQTQGTPQVSVYSTDTDSVNLKINYPQSAGMSAPVQVSIWNIDTNNATTKSYMVMFDAQGMANLNVPSLRTGTNYAFVVKVGTSSSNFSSPSSPVGAKTL